MSFVKCVSKMRKKESIDTRVNKLIQSSLSYKNCIYHSVANRERSTKYFSLSLSSSQLFRETEIENGSVGPALVDENSKRKVKLLIQHILAVNCDLQNMTKSFCKAASLINRNYCTLLQVKANLTVSLLNPHIPLSLFCSFCQIHVLQLCQNLSSLPPTRKGTW